MRSLKWAMWTLVAVVAGFFAVAMWLPSHYRVERETVIHAAPSRVFPHVAVLRRWPEWSIWYERDKTIQASYEGPESGAGAVSRWRGVDGEGSLRVTDMVPDARLVYDLSFNAGQFKSEGEIVLVPEGATTRVLWRMSGETGGNPIERYFALMMDKWVGRDFEDGLAKLKRVVEAESAGR